MAYVKLLALAIGICLFGWVLSQADLAAIWPSIRDIGFSGVLLIVGIYAVYFYADVIAWNVTLLPVEVSMRWTARLYLVRIIGEAYNNVMPAASMGGEPIKAWLLKTKYQIPYTASGASLVLAKTASMFVLVIAAAIAVIAAVARDELSDLHRSLAYLALAWFTFNVIVFFLMQHWKLSTLTAKLLKRSALADRVARLIGGMHGLDDYFHEFYRRHKTRFAIAMGFAGLNYVFGVFELYVTYWLIGYPVSMYDAFLLESAVQLIRTIVFFIPSAVGAQEGIFMLASGILIGNQGAGIAAALIRRVRELVWIALGLFVATFYPIVPRNVAAEVAQSS